MLNEELIDVVNGGEAWALVGSGASAMAGGPSWEQLAHQIAKYCRDRATSTSFSQIRFDKEVDVDILTAFGQLEDAFGREVLEAGLTEVLAGLHDPGPLHVEIARWPFAGYVTPNFDRLLDTQLEVAAHAAWTTVGNAASENRKICRDVRNVVWHAHGVVGAPSKNLRLVISKNDYDELYAERSPTVAAMETLLRTRRFVIFGFGFRDPDLLSVLQHIHRVTTPDKPTFAFFPNCSVKDGEEFRQKYNVEVIHYPAHANDHSGLLALLGAYRAFILTRDTQFAVPASVRPEYDREVTSLLTHNRLLARGALLSRSAQKHLLTAFVLQRAAEEKHFRIAELHQSLNLCGSGAKALLEDVLAELSKQDLLRLERDSGSLTPEGRLLVEESKSQTQLLRDQFLGELQQRAKTLQTSGTKSDAAHVAQTAAHYFEVLGERCGLAIAQQLCTTEQASARARQVAILDALHEFLPRCKSRDDAFLLVRLVRDVIGSPTDPERIYLGYLSQAYFGRHLLNSDPTTHLVDRDEVQSTVFLLDASVLIHLLAVGARRHPLAKDIFSRLQELGSPIITTHTLIEEVAEHANWAWRELKDHEGTSREMIDACRGGCGRDMNVFLEGYLLNATFGPHARFQVYFDEMVNAKGKAPHVTALTPHIQSLGIEVVPLADLEGLQEKHVTQRRSIERQITKLRKAKMTYRHDRQVEAEAEVAVIVDGLRSGELRLGQKTYEDALFVAHSRVLDELPDIAKYLNISPSSLLDWLLTTREIDKRTAGALFDQILQVLSQTGIELLPRRELTRVFAGIVDASRDRVSELKRERRDLIRQRYGTDADQAFSHVDPLAWPAVKAELENDIVELLASKLAEERRAKQRVEEELKRSVRDEKEYARLKALEEARRAKATKRQRREASRRKKKKKGKKSRRN